MDSILKSVLSIVICFLSLNISGQIIPSEWEGLWQGEVEIWSNNSKMDSFPMSLEITPKDSTWSFVINYKKDSTKPDVRQYELIVIDSSKYHLAIDEKNSIILDSYFNDNCIYTRFGGMGSDLQMRTCLTGGELHYEIISTSSEPVRVSGNQTIEDNTIPEIKSYGISNIMKARLIKED